MHHKASSVKWEGYFKLRGCFEMFLIYKKCKYIVKQNNCKLKSYHCFAQLNLRFILNKIPLYLQISKDKNNVFCTNAKNMFS